MGPVHTPMRVRVCVRIVVDAGGAPSPKCAGGDAMFGCYGNQHAQWRHEFVWCHGVRCLAATPQGPAVAMLTTFDAPHSH